MSCCQPQTTYATATGQLSKLEGPRFDAPKRNHYYFSKMMDVLQFEMEQSYLNDKRWLLNRLSLGEGVLCGLKVFERDGKLCIAPGVAIDSFGHEVIVPGQYCLDPWLLPDACGKPRKELPRDKAHRVTICLGYRECLADQAPVLVTDCRAESLCEAGSVVESFDIWVREGWPKTRKTLCEALERQVQGKTGGYEVIATIDAGGKPIGVAVAHDGRRALVINATEAPKLQVIDVATNTIVHELSEPLRPSLGGVSVAPEGGLAFVTHGDGLLSVDLSAATPVAQSVVKDRAYGAVVAASDGHHVFAINTQSKLVEAIQVSDGAIKPLKFIKQPIDLAISSDSAVLFVADNAAKTLYAVNAQTLKELWNSPLEDALTTLAATGADAAIEAWAARVDKGQRFVDDGSSTTVTFKAGPTDSAFNSQGERLHLASSAEIVGGASAGPDEVVILQRDDTTEIARLPVGRGANGVAVVPSRARAYITAADGTVTVIDVPSLRERLCRLLQGPCPGIDPKPCVELATIELLPGGKIGKIDTCTHRTTLLSNEKLLELILCLADRLDRCCDGHAPPPPPDDPPDPPPTEVELLKITGVSFIDGAGNIALSMDQPNQLAVFKASRKVDRIRVTLNRAYAPGTVTTVGPNDDPKKASVLITSERSTRPLGAVVGSLQFDSPTSFVFKLGPDADIFTRDSYRMTLFGDVDVSGARPAITGTNGARLDGEPAAFPSGNGAQGGDFIIKFEAQ